MISEDLILRIKEENDIVDVISQVVNLKKTGRNYIGLCPFHGEKTPSFTVSPDKQIFKCFGCGEAGNVYTFIMKNRNVTFPEAVKILGDRVNISIEEDKGNSPQREKREKLYKINVEAARYFYKNLNNNSKAKNYFLKRGITSKTLVKFGLGYAMDGWSNLINYLKGKGYTELDMIEAGLIIKSKNDSYYDRFRNRVIFPVFDYKGKVIGFGGRVLDDSKPKYLNSPETYVFKKGTNLYGLNFALNNFNGDTLIIVEGYMDCISLHQSGITYVVASLGTAFTQYQAKLLKRYVKKIIISYDSDAAGQAATLRGLEILKKEGFDVRVLTIPDGKDPDEFVKNHGKEAFEELIEEALPLTEYRIKVESNGINFDDKEMIIRYTKKLIPILADLQPIEQDLYIKRVAQKANVNQQALYDMINRYLNRKSKNYGEMDFAQDSTEKLYLEPAYIKAERVLINTMLKDNSKIEDISGIIKPKDMVQNIHREIYEYILKNSQLPSEQLAKSLETKCIDVESSKEFVKILETEILDEGNYAEAIKDCIAQIKKSKLEESKKTIMDRIRKYESEGNLEESIRLAKELVDIQKEISQI
ncbi:DNA primase [Haloimpatiens lingqiaonensis]|uniref:DNA primase n=1 Tax=Haloimpatiens lingqiaonensis TaxID=1380675 RepID=UPI0010FEB2B0|nr:DNA primase [Haloimpatiens lingqiaonensis]